MYRKTEGEEQKQKQQITTNPLLLSELTDTEGKRRQHVENMQRQRKAARAGVSRNTKSLTRCSEVNRHSEKEKEEKTEEGEDLLTFAHIASGSPSFGFRVLLQLC